jgi:hypothetical protein
VPRGQWPEEDLDEDLAGPPGHAVDVIFPYRNVPALIGYYLGLLALIPLIGFIVGIPALIMGIIGLKRREQDPAVRGSVHAWIGIILGGLAILLWGGLIALILVAALLG